jgi:hypothetical protein
MSSWVSYSPKAKLAIAGLKVAKNLVNRLDHSLLEVERVRFSEELNTEQKQLTIM